nr:hypothetical protein [Dyadobacter sp. CY323]
MALTVDDALDAVTLLQGTSTAIFGGDILTENNGNLIYAYQLWGEEYIYLNWYCDPLSGESKSAYSQRSHKMAIESIKLANDIAEHLKNKCLVVLVIDVNDLNEEKAEQ